MQFAAPAAAHAQTRHDGFSVVLLLGETQGTAAGDGLPPARTGETVVVGTSKIGGHKGLVVLLTAVAAGGK